MSTPTFDTIGRAARAAACLLTCAFLAGCGGFGGFGGGPPAPASVAVTADRIVVTGPEGYCVDPTATRDSGDTGFVLLGNCAAIANSRRAAQPATPAVLTAAVSEPSDGGQLAESMGELDAFFRSDDGLRLISRTGEAATVTVLDTAIEGDVFLLHAADTSAGAIEGVQGEYWRAYLDVGNRIATLSVIALEDRALSRDDSLTTLRDFVLAVQAANAGPTEDAAPPVAPVHTPPRNKLQRGGPLFNVGLFRRILS
jgi:hypothetical protein